MREKGNDELSALMDGEATELEMHRVLRMIEEDPAQAAKWQRYHLASAILKKETRPCSGQQLLSIDLSSRVSAALADEPLIMRPVDSLASRPPSTSVPGWWRPVANVAIAASVATAVVLGWQINQAGVAPAAQPPTVAHAAPANSGAMAAVPVGAPAQNVMPVQYGSVVPVSPSYGVMPRSVSVPVEYVRPQKLDEQRFNHYLFSHSGNAALATQAGSQLPYVRVVTLKPVEAQR